MPWQSLWQLVACHGIHHGNSWHTMASRGACRSKPWQPVASHGKPRQAPRLAVGHDAATARSTVGPTASDEALTMAAYGSVTGRVMSTPTAKNPRPAPRQGTATPTASHGKPRGKPRGESHGNLLHAPRQVTATPTASHKAVASPTATHDNPHGKSRQAPRRARPQATWQGPRQGPRQAPLQASRAVLRKCTANPVASCRSTRARARDPEDLRTPRASVVATYHTRVHTDVDATIRNHSVRHAQSRTRSER